MFSRILSQTYSLLPFAFGRLLFTILWRNNDPEHCEILEKNKIKASGAKAKNKKIKNKMAVRAESDNVEYRTEVLLFEMLDIGVN